MNRAQARRQRWLERFDPRPGDDGLVCHEAARGGMILVEPEKVQASHARRMELFDQLRPEYRTLANDFHRLQFDINELLSWSRCGTPVEIARRTLEDRAGKSPATLRMLRIKRPRGERRWKPPEDVL